MTLCGHTAQCRTHGEVYRLLGAVLVVESDSSGKERPAVRLLHTVGVKQSVAEGAAQGCEGDLQGAALCGLVPAEPPPAQH